jgi:PAS domain S-box-containing protein
VEGLELGAVDFVTKPFQRQELLARVRTHLELGRLRAHLEQQVAERTAELRESEERFRTMANAAPVLIWLSDVHKQRNFFNWRWLEFTGRTAEEELGNGWLADVHPDDAERFYEAYSSAFDARTNFQVECRLRRADGVYRWVLDSGVPRFRADGAFDGYIGSGTDITDLKQENEKMLAVQKLESLGVMAAGVAHDFSNLLSSILAETEVALSDMPSDALGRESFERINAVASGAAEVVKLLLASAGAGVDPSSMELVDVSEVAEQTLRLLKGSISKRAVFRTNFANGLSRVRGNVAQIRQIVMNLITNACEALGGKEGFVSVSTERAHFGSERATTDHLELPDGNYVRLTVSDTGCGMTPETRAKIFDQFFTTKSSGRGLGLAAVHGIVRS